MRIQIVDDSSFIILVCRQALENTGHTIVAESYDGLEAIQHAEENKPDVIIMDIALPKKNGFEATEMILEFLPQAKVIAISAIDDHWVKEKAIAAGCCEFLGKPFDTMQLIDIIEGLKNDSEELKYG